MAAHARRPAPAAGLDQFQAVFHSSKRHAIERRGAELMLRDEGHDGATAHTLTGPGRQPVVIRYIVQAGRGRYVTSPFGDCPGSNGRMNVRW